MPAFMLDTDMVSFALRGQGGVAARCLDRRPSEQCISSITLAELRFGAAMRRSRKLNRLISAFVEHIEVMPFDQDAATEFGKIAAVLARRDQVIGNFDALIAAQVLALKLVFVTNNSRHFLRVPGLPVENWV